MRLLVFLAAALFATAMHAQAQVYAPYDGYDEYDGYGYDDPYSPYPPPPYYEPEPSYREPLQERQEPSTRIGRGTIVIATSEHTLIYTTPWGEQFAYPIAVGREGKQWYGKTRVVSKRLHPEWRPTASMRQKNPRLPAVVKPGPANPLGTRAIYLADGLLRIHGTNDPSSIGTNASSGCFRMYRQDVEELYEMVQPGTQVVVQR
ncbi:L,D-transpeptidase (plasmid) [Rhizobium ruizarguesonis]|jgi:lipoprotein-anchoring transpeptidase ErfK/SrfK|uniref:L,D-transpeptidase n=1 Tax=Rhizobium ruizarguesonis TaxID=2081791 RepID=UPI000462928C|nr:L,D-transpeptidase [Rhizobium ruizarguesonis]MBY5828318.1 L,D-transpeptidase [Rhizobium leguminosarum]NKL26832.1 L,D-transpeptidase family protein [Rhizobium leguminosarum bv. viciae]MBC2808181.1 L,D-transpeptidase [Rhizobium ruizarguesonis]MBY5853979.1 L,D-transpeptidase [Rhizobium leguminosarum]MBY5857091.1 L,D-transpeptidase [Rhizobium leguminosarum]